MNSTEIPVPCRQEAEHKRMSVLVVEDNADSASTMAQLLRLHGYEPRVALDGPTALRKAREAQPDVVLLDIGLPGIDGYEVAQRVREEAQGRNPFIIAITGFGRDEDRRRANKAGIDLHLLKPVDFKDLQPLLKRFEDLVLLES